MQICLRIVYQQVSSCGSRSTTRFPELLDTDGALVLDGQADRGECQGLVKLPRPKIS